MGRAKGISKEFFSPKIRDFYGSGWVGPGLTRNFFGKSSQNSPKPVLIFGVVFHDMCILYV